MDRNALQAALTGQGGGAPMAPDQMQPPAPPPVNPQKIQEIAKRLEMMGDMEGASIVMSLASTPSTEGSF